MVTHSSILAGKFHGQRRLAGYSPWGCKELETIEQLSMTKERCRKIHYGPKKDKKCESW